MKLTRTRLVLAILLIVPVVVVVLSYLEDVLESSGGAERSIADLLLRIPQESMQIAVQMGYAGVFALMLLEAAAFPIPSEIVLPFAGYLVALGKLSFWPVIFFSTVAALAGSFVDYYLGLKLGPLLLVPGRIPFVDANRLSRVNVWFNRYGGFAVVFLRLVPGARVLISFPAGAYQMKKSKFAVYTLAGCLPWNIVLVYLGWWFGSSWDYVVGLFRYINVVAYLLTIVAVVWLLFRLKPGAFKSVLRTNIVGAVGATFQPASV